MEFVILVDENDNEIGQLEKLEAHTTAMLHRAFSIFIFNSEGKMLLQKRAADKYHSPGLWTNACCSHPRPGEKTEEAAVRRLKEELGFVTDIQHSFSFTYKAKFDNGLTEHEYDHVYTGIYDGPIFPAKEEVSDYVFKSLDLIEGDLAKNPNNYTAWFHLAFPRLLKNYIAR